MKILEYGIYLIVFCLPMYLLRFSIFGIPTNVLEVMIGVLFLVWLVKQIANSEQRTANKEFKKLFIVHCSLFIAIPLILIGVTMTTIFSWDLQVSAGIWKSWFIIPLLFFIVVINVIKKPKQIRNIFWAFILSGFVISIISLVYLIQGNLDIQGRLQGFYNSPNYLAMYLAPALILSAGLFFMEKKKILKILLFIVLCSLFIVLFFTKSFGAWLGIILAICFSLWLINRRLIGLALCLALISVLILGYFSLTYKEPSLNARLIIWQKAWQVFKTYPILGIGPGTFQDYFPVFPKWGVPQPHNLYLAFLLQTGIVGFIGFIWLVILFFKKGFEMLKTQNLLVIIIMSAMVYILAHGLVDTTYWKNDLAVIFWLILALLNRVGR